MKKIIIPVLMLLAGFAFTGCDDLLDAVPKDRLSADTFFKSESELQAFSIGFYELFPTSELYVANDDHFTQNNMSNEGMGKRTIPASGSGNPFMARNSSVLSSIWLSLPPSVTTGSTRAMSGPSTAERMVSSRAFMRS